jgi:hypothetical protein
VKQGKKKPEIEREKKKKGKKRVIKLLGEGWDKQARWKPSEFTCNEKDSEQILAR